jgi:hypothetical protein
MADPTIADVPERVTEWRTVPFASAYEVNESGEIRRRIAGKGYLPGMVLKPGTRHPFGYVKVRLTIDGKNKKFERHHVVAAAFLGPKPFPGAEVAHLDGSKDNDHYLNLKWTTHKENESHKERHGTQPRGEKNGTAKLSEEIVREIRAVYPAQGSLTVLARRFGVNYQTISKIVNRKSWQHVDAE